MMSTIAAIGALLVSLGAAFVWAVLHGVRMNEKANELEDASDYIETRKAIDNAKAPINTPVDVDALRDELRERPKDQR